MTFVGFQDRCLKPLGHPSKVLHAASQRPMQAARRRPRPPSGPACPRHRIVIFMAPSLAIIGAGMGGLTLAAALHQRGIDAQVYEQAPRFVRIGAGIQMSPNAMRVLRGIGLEQRIRATAFQPHSWTNRDWDTGKLTNELPLGADAEAKYGAPYLLMHRGDLHEALASRVPRERIALDKKLTELDWRSGGVTLRFADGTTARADAVVA